MSIWEDRITTLNVYQAVLDPAGDEKRNKALDDFHKQTLEGFQGWKKKSVLDYGCGWGRLSNWLQQKGISFYYGYDSEPAMLAKAKSMRRFGYFSGTLPLTGIDIALCVYVEPTPVALKEIATVGAEKLVFLNYISTKYNLSYYARYLKGYESSVVLPVRQGADYVDAFMVWLKK